MSKMGESVLQIRELVHRNRLLTVHTLANEVKMSFGQIATKFVPHLLTSRSRMRAVWS
jgi:hypothetical protein